MSACRPIAGWLAAGCLVLQACAPGLWARGTLPTGLDSPSATCRNSLSACAALDGKETASVMAVLEVALDSKQKAALEQVLKECADQAHSNVLLRHEGTFQKLAPLRKSAANWRRIRSARA